jgi:hypothetical protein
VGLGLGGVEKVGQFGEELRGFLVRRDGLMLVSHVQDMSNVPRHVLNGPFLLCFSQTTGFKCQVGSLRVSFTGHVLR